MLFNIKRVQQDPYLYKATPQLHLKLRKIFERFNTFLTSASEAFHVFLNKIGKQTFYCLLSKIANTQEHFRVSIIAKLHIKLQIQFSQEHRAKMKTLVPNYTFIMLICLSFWRKKPMVLEVAWIKHFFASSFVVSRISQIPRAFFIVPLVTQVIEA